MAYPLYSTVLNLIGVFRLTIFSMRLMLLSAFSILSAFNKTAVSFSRPLPADWTAKNGDLIANPIDHILLEVDVQVGFYLLHVCLVAGILGDIPL